ncbi:MAG: hypothetical protein A3D94_14635 [Alphaproteobacteria bacterium RIFCSPHIGHO2_12_FULL_66_14]|jgi:hypothetical protein|nr:MAG: hypothetical protein A3D94_14635 [Alphaproteobacteria bacterium RIFCSPHIGHO2_12_FULL_66_14]
MPQQIKNVLLVLTSIALSVLVAEAVVRYVDGYAMFAMPLSAPSGSATVGQDALDQVPRAAGVERDWFFTDPPPLPNRRKVPDEWNRLYRLVQDNPAGGMDFRPSDVFKAWNSVFAGDPCKHRLLHHAPGQLYVYDPPDGTGSPPYRFLPDVTLPTRLVTNQIGWRGAPIEDPRGEKTIRIVFVGSSTTIDAHHLPFSWPEFAGHWLNQWAKAKRLPVRFEVLNAGRESITSTDIAAVVRTEVLPLRPDLVVYYEGGNQFRPASIVDVVPKGSAVRPPQADASPSWLLMAARYSALIARVQAAVGAAASTVDGHEWPKPDYRVVWPEGLDERDPDLAYPRLPVSLNVIQRDLDRIRTDLATVGSDFAVSSFMWMVKDGLVLNPIRHKYILEQLNVANYPFRYRELERLAAFQNRLLAKYAAVHGLTFVDIARYSPFEPDHFTDAVHTNYAGTRLRGWIVFNQLLPTVEKHLADGSWPRAWPAGAPSTLPTFTPRQIALACE